MNLFILYDTSKFILLITLVDFLWPSSKFLNFLLFFLESIDILVSLKSFSISSVEYSSELSKRFSSLNSCSKVLNVDRGTIRKYLKGNKVFKDQWQFSYLSK